MVSGLQGGNANFKIEGDNFTEFDKALLKIVEQKLKILISKKEMRGTANIERQGLMGVMNRISEDKFERVKKMVEDDFLSRKLKERGIVNNHSELPKLDTSESKIQLEDDLMDIANYCDIMVLMLRGQWK